MGKLRSPYGLWLALGLLFALSSMGFDSPDEHFPTLEAAGRFLFGHYFAVWEWSAGIRNYIHPLILAAWLKPFVAIGIENRLWLDSIARIFNVLWFLPAIWAVGRLSGRTAQWWLASAWPMVVWGTRHGADNFGIPPMLVGFALLHSGIRGAPLPLVAGFAMGFGFEVRPTTGLFSVLGVGVLTFITRQTKFKQACVCGAGFLAMAVALGSVDWIMYARLGGQGKIPAWEFFNFSALHQAGNYHASPWYELLVYSLILWVPTLGWLTLPRLRDRARGNERWAALTWLASTLAFMAIKHKEMRFDFPLIPFCLLATVTVLRGWEVRAAAAANAFMLVLALLLYRDPHGTLVRALDVASRESNTIWLSGMIPNFPEFYVRGNAKVNFISDEEARQVCRERRTGALITAEPCSSCSLLGETDPGLGYRLRQRVSSTPAFRYIYRCP